MVARRRRRTLPIKAALDRLGEGARAQVDLMLAAEAVVKQANPPRRPRARRLRRPEEAIHRRAVEWLKALEHAGRLTFLHPYNGGARTKAEAGVGKALGVRAGAWDLVVWHAKGGFGFEFKAKAGSVSGTQREFHARLARFGWRTYVVKSIDEFRAALEAEGIDLTGYAVAGYLS